MLLTKEVEIGLGGNNATYFEKLRYKIPRRKNRDGIMNVPRGTKIKVKVEDLPDRSSVFVNVKCDCKDCLTPILKPIRWYNYKISLKEDGKYYCNKCAMNLFGRGKILETKLKNSKSFEQWCIENKCEDVLYRWDYELNDCKPSEIGYSTNKKYYFKCPKGLHKSELKTISNYTSGGKEGSITCKACNSFAQYLIDNFGENALDKYWDYGENNQRNINPWIISKNSEKKIYLICQEVNYHKNYETTCSIFLLGSRCPYCSNHKIHPLDSLGALYPEVLNIWSDKNKRSPYEYAPKSNKKVWWKCPEELHKDFLRSISGSSISNYRCPECQYSKGEEVISKYFINKIFIKIANEDYKILDDVLKEEYQYYIPQMKFDDLIGLGNGLLSYDFYLPNQQHNLLIEYDGIFHYEPVKKYKNEPIKFAEERLKKQQIHDQLKNEYCKNNNIKLLRIPYWDFDNIEEILNKELWGGD